MTFKFPIQTSEDWRFTDLKVLNSLTFDYAKMGMPTPEYLNQIKERFLDNTIRIVMFNGFYMKELSDLSKAGSCLEVVDSCLSSNDNDPEDGNESGNDNGSEDGTVFKHNNNLKNIEIKDCHLRECGDPSTAIIDSNMSEINQLDITIKSDLEIPIHFLNVGLSETENMVSNLQVNFIVKNNVHAKLIEEHLSLGNAQSLYKSKIMANIKADASLQHTFLQATAKTSFNLSSMRANLAKNSTYNINMVINGARLSRYDLSINLNENHAAANIHSLCLIKERQIAGVKTVVSHNVSDTKSKHLHKSIVDGGAHSMFNGTICVGLNSVRTESHQQNRSLMLSKKARVTTEPKLEINNDDVVCTHGATISQMDEDIVFFLKARGICELDAKKLCIDAFANEILSKIENIRVLKNIAL